MRPLPFTELPAQLVFAVAIITVAVLQAIAGRHTIGGLFRRGSVKRLDRGSLAVVLVTSAVGVLGCAVLSVRAPFATIAAGDTVVRYIVFGIGIAVLLAGSGLREWAVATLGRSFTFDVRIASDQQVITRGPYRWVRHPSYTGLLIAYAGLGLSLGNWLSVVVVVVLPAIGLVHRIRVEEAALVSELGQPYLDYALTHRRLLPGVW